MELTKVVERLTAALKEEKAVLERELKERAAEAEEKQKEDSSAEVKILNAEKAALRKDVMALAAEMRKESKLHADKAEEHRRVVEQLEEEKRHLEARSYKVTPTAPMGGGTQLLEGAHLTGVIRAFVASQANVAITFFWGVKSSNAPHESF